MLFGKANPTRRRMIRVTASLNEAVLNIFKILGARQLMPVRKLGQAGSTEAHRR